MKGGRRIPVHGNMLLLQVFSGPAGKLRLPPAPSKIIGRGGDRKEQSEEDEESIQRAAMDEDCFRYENGLEQQRSYIERFSNTPRKERRNQKSNKSYRGISHLTLPGRGINPSREVLLGGQITAWRYLTDFKLARQKKTS